MQIILVSFVLKSGKEIKGIFNRLEYRKEPGGDFTELEWKQPKQSIREEFGYLFYLNALNISDISMIWSELLEEELQ